MAVFCPAQSPTVSSFVSEQKVPSTVGVGDPDQLYEKTVNCMFRNQGLESKIINVTIKKHILIDLQLCLK